MCIRDRCIHELFPRNVKMLRLFIPSPPMATKLQPMDQGIIKNLKVHYRKRILANVLRAINENKPFKTSKLISLKECVEAVSKAWSQGVTGKTITRYFKKTQNMKMKMEQTRKQMWMRFLRLLKTPGRS